MELISTDGRIILVDEDDYDFLSTFSWYIADRKFSGYAWTWVNRKKTYMARLIMYENGHDIDGKYVDHKNHNTLDNRKNNLRICTNAENCRNVNKTVNKKSSIYKGVCARRYKQNTYWHARLTYNGTSINIGCFKTEKEAAIAYNIHAVKYFGEFALLNDVD